MIKTTTILTCDICYNELDVKVHSEAEKWFGLDIYNGVFKISNIDNDPYTAGHEQHLCSLSCLTSAINNVVFSTMVQKKERPEKKQKIKFRRK